MYSQWGQDEWLDKNIFAGKKNGIFVEVGALDGLADSNTLMFAKHRNWRGVLIEANPEFAESLKINRPESEIVNCAAYDIAGRVSLKCVEGIPGWNGIEKEFEHEHQIRVNKQHTHYITVPCKPLAQMLAAYPKIDYISIDVEGAEYKVLNTFPFNHFDVTALTIENNYGNKRVELLMQISGYRLVTRIKYDDVYLKAIL